MTTNESTYWTRRLSRRTVLRGAGAAATGLGAVALAGCMGGSKKDSMSGSTPAKPKAELIIYRGSSPNLTVRDPDTTEIKRSADVPNLQAWTWNDSENYFDGQNLWMVGFNRENKAPDYGGAEVIIVNADSLAVTKRIPLGKEGTAMAANGLISNGMMNIGRGSPDGKVFVGKMYAGEVTVIDAKTQTVFLQKKIGDSTDMACDTDHGTASDGVGRLYVATAAGHKVLALDPNTLAVLKTYEAPEGVRPIMLTVAPGGNSVWVQNFFEPNFVGEAKSLTILDAKTLAVIKEIDTGSSYSFYAGFSPDAKLAYVAHSDRPYVSVFDTVSFAEVRRIELPMAMAAPVVAIHPDGGSIWIGAGTGTESFGVRVDTMSWMMSDPIGRVPTYPGQGGYFMRRLG